MSDATERGHRMVDPSCSDTKDTPKTRDVVFGPITGDKAIKILYRTMRCQYELGSALHVLSEGARAEAGGEGLEASIYHLKDRPGFLHFLEALREAVLDVMDYPEFREVGVVVGGGSGSEAVEFWLTWARHRFTADHALMSALVKGSQGDWDKGRAAGQIDLDGVTYRFGGPAAPPSPFLDVRHTIRQLETHAERLAIAHHDEAKARVAKQCVFSMAWFVYKVLQDNCLYRDGVTEWTDRWPWGVYPDYSQDPPIRDWFPVVPTPPTLTPPRRVNSEDKYWDRNGQEDMESAAETSKREADPISRNTLSMSELLEVFRTPGVNNGDVEDTAEASNGEAGQISRGAMADTAGGVHLIAELCEATLGVAELLDALLDSLPRAPGVGNGDVEGRAETSNGEADPISRSTQSIPELLEVFRAPGVNNGDVEDTAKTSNGEANPTVGDTAERRDVVFGPIAIEETFGIRLYTYHLRNALSGALCLAREEGARVKAGGSREVGGVYYLGVFHLEDRPAYLDFLETLREAVLDLMSYPEFREVGVVVGDGSGGGEAVEFWLSWARDRFTADHALMSALFKCSQGDWDKGRIAGQVDLDGVTYQLDSGKAQPPFPFLETFTMNQLETHVERLVAAKGNEAKARIAKQCIFSMAWFVYEVLRFNCLYRDGVTEWTDRWPWGVYPDYSQDPPIRDWFPLLPTPPTLTPPRRVDPKDKSWYRGWQQQSNGEADPDVERGVVTSDSEADPDVEDAAEASDWVPDPNMEDAAETSDWVPDPFDPSSCNNYYAKIDAPKTRDMAEQDKYIAKALESSYKRTALKRILSRSRIEEAMAETAPPSGGEVDVLSRDGIAPARVLIDSLYADSDRVVVSHPVAFRGVWIYYLKHRPFFLSSLEEFRAEVLGVVSSPAFREGDVVVGEGSEAVPFWQTWARDRFVTDHATMSALFKCPQGDWDEGLATRQLRLEGVTYRLGAGWAAPSPFVAAEGEIGQLRSHALRLRAAETVEDRARIARQCIYSMAWFVKEVLRRNGLWREGVRAWEHTWPWSVYPDYRLDPPIRGLPLVPQPSTRTPPERLESGFASYHDPCFKYPDGKGGWFTKNFVERAVEAVEHGQVTYPKEWYLDGEGRPLYDPGFKYHDDPKVKYRDDPTVECHSDPKFRAEPRDSNW